MGSTVSKQAGSKVRKLASTTSATGAASAAASAVSASASASASAKPGSDHTTVLASKTPYEKFVAQEKSTPPENNGQGPAVSAPQDHTGTRDGEDPQFSDRLRQLGAFDIPAQVAAQQQLQRKQVYSVDNVLVNALASREKITHQAQTNMDDASAPRQYLHPQTITAVLEAREQDKDGVQRIESDFNLAPGVLDRLGPYIRRPTAKAAPIRQNNPGRENRAALKAMSMSSDMEGEVPH